MKLIALLLGLLPLIAAGCTVLEEEKKEPEPSGEMAEWMKANAPGENHKLLEKMAGDWDAEVTFVFDPTKAPEVNKTTSKKEMVLGGRFLFSAYEIKTGAMPHSGRGYIGYNNLTKKFQMMNLSTTYTAMEMDDGDYDAKTKAITFKSAMKELDWGGQKIRYSTRTVITLESDDKHTFSIFTTYPDMKEMEGKEIEEVKIVYTRRK